MEAREVRRIVDGAAAYGVEHQDIGRVAAARNHRIIFGPPAHVGAEVKGSAAKRDLPVRAARRVVAGLDPVALLEAHNLRPVVCQPLRDGRARSTGADHEHVGALLAHQGASR